MALSFLHWGKASLKQPTPELSPGLCIFTFPFHLNSAICASGAYDLTTLSYRQNQTEATRTFGSLLVLDSGPFSVRVPRFGSFPAAEALGTCLLVKLIFITCNGAQIPWYWPWPWGWYIIGRKMQWDLEELRGLQKGRGLKVPRKGKLELVSQKCGWALTFHSLLWPL